MVWSHYTLPPWTSSIVGIEVKVWPVVCRCMVSLVTVLFIVLRLCAWLVWCCAMWVFQVDAWSTETRLTSHPTNMYYNVGVIITSAIYSVLVIASHCICVSFNTNLSRYQ